MGCVYCITNIIDNLKYIGMTINTLDYRMYDHLYQMKNRPIYPLHRSMLKYGIDKFIWYELFISDIRSELLNKEKDYIISLNTVRPNGFNLTTGGECPEISEETRNKLKLAWIGRVVSEQSKIKTSITLQDPKLQAKMLKTRQQREDVYRQNLVSAYPGFTKYKGVTWSKRRNKWIAIVTLKGGKRVYAGISKDENIAAVMYNNKAIELLGNNTVLNKIATIS